MDNNSTPSLPDLVLPSVVTTLSLPSKHAATDMRLPQAWLLRSVPDEENRSAASGKIYDDALEFRYVYDSKVPNHKNVREGDFVLIRDNSILLGSAVIRKIESYEADKVMTYCPTCGSTRITFKSDGLWRCDGKCLRRDNLKPEQRLHKNPPQKTEKVQRFIAYYGDTWTELIGAADKDSFKDLSVPGKYNTQNSIVALHTGKVLDWLESLNTSGIHLLPLGGCSWGTRESSWRFYDAHRQGSQRSAAVPSAATKPLRKHVCVYRRLPHCGTGCGAPVQLCARG